MIDLSVLAQIFMAFATFLLALFTFWNIKQNKGQLKLFNKEILVLQNQQAPVLTIQECKFKDNKIKIKIKNVGSGIATELGVESHFSLGKFDVHEIKNRKTVGKFNFDSEELIDFGENRKIKDNGYISFLLKKVKPVYLNSGEEDVLEVTPDFFVYYSREDVPRQGTLGRIIKFQELVDILKFNKKRFLGLEFELVYKDINEKKQNEVQLAKFIFDLQRHNDLESSHKEYWRFDYTALSHYEITTLNGLPSRFYDKLVSRKNWQHIDNEKI